MANTGKHIAPSRNHAPRGGVPVTVDGSPVPTDTRLSPRVEMLRQLVASGQYQVNARYLAYKIFRAAGVRAESR